MRVVVIGATGNVGVSVLEKLAEESSVEEIIGVARRIPTWTPPKTRWRQADISSSQLDQVLEGSDAVVHLAWIIHPERDEQMLAKTNVLGAQRVFEAVTRVGISTLVCASSVGVYAEKVSDEPVDESWPATGVQTSVYARQKAAVERLLDDLEARNPDLRVVRMRPGLTFQRAAGASIRRYFGGPLLPSALLRPGRIPFVPDTPGLRLQVVHSEDLADAYRLAVVNDQIRGPFNIATDPVLAPREIARVLKSRTIPIPANVLRTLGALSWNLHLQPTSPGWIDMGLKLPVMDTSRAKHQMKWAPRFGAEETLLELLDGMRERAGRPTAVLQSRPNGRP